MLIIRIIIYFNFQPLEVVSRYRDPQPQVVKITHTCICDTHEQVNMYSIYKGRR